MLDEIQISSFERACLMQYLGVECIRCATSGTSRFWVFRCKQFDAESIEEDFRSDQTTVLLADWLKAETRIRQLVQMAHKNISGEWLAPTYTKHR